MADTGLKRESKLYICATPQAADLNQSGYEGLTWVEIGNIVTLPDFGVSDNMVTQDYINTDVSQRQKGFRQASETELVVGRDYEDAGQDAIRTAAATRNNYALKLESSDGSATLTPTTRYSRGVIGGPNFTGGGGEDFDNETFQIGLNQAPITVDPTAIP
jgi:hypothetical protein